MASTTFLGIILLLVSPQVFMSGDHSVKVLPVVLGTSGVLRPDDAVTSIISITWRHDGRVVANWFEGNPKFYFQCIGRCSLNTTTGELTINHVTLEDRVPKPTNPEETSWSLNSPFSRTDVFKTPDDRRVNGTEDSKEETFVSSLNNSVLLPKTNSSSDTSHYYTYYLLTVGLPVGLSVLIVVGLVWIFRFKGHQKISRFVRGRNEPRTSADAGHHPEEASKGHQEDMEMTPLNVEQQLPPGDQAPPPTCNGTSSHSVEETPSSLNPEMMDGADVSRDAVRVGWGS